MAVASIRERFFLSSGMLIPGSDLRGMFGCQLRNSGERTGAFRRVSSLKDMSL
jgi:hypothetical protein